MANTRRFNLTTRSLFISLATVSFFATACGSDSRPFASSDTPAPANSDDPGTSGAGSSTIGTGAGGSSANATGTGGSSTIGTTTAPASSGALDVKVHPQSSVKLTGTAAGIALPSPSAMMASDTSTISEALHLDASAFSTKLPNAFVSTANTAATFSPTSGTNAAPAYAVYRLSAPGFATSGKPQSVRLDWQGDAPDSSKLWVGLARFGADRWDFFAGPDDGVLTIDSFAPYQDDAGDVIFVIALTDDSPRTLTGLTAGEPEMRGTGLGKPSAPPDLAGQALTATAPLPSSVNLRPSMPWVRNQGSIGSCTGFASAGLFNYELNVLYAKYGWDDTQDTNQTSPRWLYNQVPFSSGDSCPSDGHDLTDVGAFLVSNGDATEHDAPYGSTKSSDYDCSTSFFAAAYDDAAVLRPTAYHTFYPGGDAGIAKAKELLASGKGIAFGIHVDSTFKSYDSGVWNYPSGATALGGHAIVIAGYDDSKQAFYVRNSWGYDWGESGYIWIGYDSFRSGDMVYGNAYYLDLDFNLQAAERLIGSMPQVQPPPHVNATDGTFTDKVAVSWDAARDASGYKVYRDAPTNLVATISSGTTWNDTTLTDSTPHRYFVTATAHSKGGDVETAPGAPDSGYLAADPLVKAVTPTSGTSGSILTLGVQVVGAGPFTYAWDFGGGATPATGTDANPAVVLGAVGTHKAHVTVTDPKGSAGYDFDLVVDYPASVWLHTWGGTSSDTSTKSVFADASGATYLAGSTKSYGKGQQDALVLKYDASGGLGFAATWGTAGIEVANAVAADSQGNTYFVGTTDTSKSGGDILFGKLDPTGTPVFAKAIGGAGLDAGWAIAVTANDDLYVAGTTMSVGQGGTDIIVLKLATDGHAVWQRTVGTAGNEYAESIATSPDGHSVYVTGQMPGSSGMSDLVVTKLDDAGNFGWARDWGTAQAEFDTHVVTARDGNVYVSCTTHADTFGNQDVAVLGYDPKGGLRFQRAMGGIHYSSATNENHGLAVDAANDVFVLADYVDGNQSGLYQHYLYKLDTDGNFVWTRSVNDQPNQTHLASMAMSPTGKLAFGGSAQDAGTYTWQTTTNYQSGNPTGTTETAANVSLGLSTLTVADASGTFGAPKAQLDGGTGGVAQSLACTYNPNQ